MQLTEKEENIIEAIRDETKQPDGLTTNYARCKLCGDRVYFWGRHLGNNHGIRARLFFKKE